MTRTATGRPGVDPAGRPDRSPLGKRGAGRIELPTSPTRTENHATRPCTHCCYKRHLVLEPGIEPGTYCVLGSRHNQLDHSSAKFRTSSEGLEPPISRFVVSRLIQLGHEDFPMLPPPATRGSIPPAQAPIYRDRPPSRPGSTPSSRPSDRDRGSTPKKSPAQAPVHRDRPPSRQNGSPTGI